MSTDTESTPDVAEARKLYGVRGNAMILAVILACWLLFRCLVGSSGRYNSLGELFFGFHTCGVPGLLLLLYILLATVVPRKVDGRSAIRVNHLVALILSVPISVPFFTATLLYLDKKNYVDSPFAFALPGIYIMLFAVMAVVFLVFYLLNARLIAFWIRSEYRGGFRAFLLRLLVLAFLLAAVLGLSWLRLTWREQQHRQMTLEGEYRILALMNRHELLLLSRAGELFQLNPESRALIPITPKQIETEFPGIAHTIREKGYESIDALSPVWLKRMPGYPKIDRTAVSPDGRWTVIAKDEGTSTLTDREGKVRPVRFYHGIWVACQVFTPDGKYVIIQGNHEFVVLSDVPIKLNRLTVWRVPET